MRRHFLFLAVAFATLYSAARASADSGLWDMFPDDAALAILIERPRQDFPTKLINPILDAALPSRAFASAVAKAVEHLTVPMLVGVYPPTRDGEKIELFVVVDLRGRTFDADQYVENYIIPVLEEGWKTTHGTAEKVEIDKSKDVRRATIRSGKETLFAYTTRDKRALLSMRALDVQHWRSGTWPKRAWAEGKEVKSLLARLSKDAAVAVVVNPEPLVRLIPRPEPNTGEDLALRILAPTDVRAATAELGWDKRGIRLRLLAALADPCRGMLGSLTGTGGSSSTFGILPEDFFAIGRIGFNSGESIVNGLYGITDTFDPAISEEYRTEIDEFQKETGVNFTSDILGGLSGEAVFGVRVDFMKKPPIAWTVVCPLGDADRFAESVARLEKHFGLKAATVPVGELPVRFVEDGPIAWAIHNKRLIIAESPPTVGEIAGAKSSTLSGEPRRETLRDCRKTLGGLEQVCVLADIDHFFGKAPIGAVMFGAGGTKLMRGTSAGVSFTTRDHMAELQFRWMKNAKPGRPDAPPADTPPDETNPEDAFDLAPLVELLVGTAGEARASANKTVVAANMRGVGQGLHIWATEHKGQFPATLKELIGGGMVGLQQFANPYDDSVPESGDNLTRDSYLIYRPGLNPQSDPREVVLAEREVVNGEGAHFLFVDGHVEFIPEPRAGELIEMIKAGAAEIRR